MGPRGQGTLGPPQRRAATARRMLLADPAGTRANADTTEGHSPRRALGKAGRSTEGWRPHPASYLLFASGDERGGSTGNSGTGRSSRPLHHAAIHAGQSSSRRERDPPAGFNGPTSWPGRQWGDGVRHCVERPANKGGFGCGGSQPTLSAALATCILNISNSDKSSNGGDPLPAFSV
jgi:hypothetical protein